MLSKSWCLTVSLGYWVNFDPLYKVILDLMRNNQLFSREIDFVIQTLWTTDKWQLIYVVTLVFDLWFHLHWIFHFLFLYQVVDVDTLFTNTETVCEVSAALLHRLNGAIADPDPEAVVIGNYILTTLDLCWLLLLWFMLDWRCIPISIWRRYIHPGEGSIRRCI